MDKVYELILERNSRETLPFLAIHESYATLLQQVDALTEQNNNADREISNLRQQLLDVAQGNSPHKTTSAATSAALKNEVRLREKLEKLQEEYNATLKAQGEEQTAALKTAKLLANAKDLNVAQESTISNLRETIAKLERNVEHLTKELDEAKSRTDLAEKQYDGLKETIRNLQDENEQLQKESRSMEARIVTEKTKTVDEVNILNEMVEALKLEVDMLRSYKKDWIDGKSTAKDDINKKVLASKEQSSSSSRLFGSFGVAVPSKPKHIISAHPQEGTCVRYDAAGSEFIATASSDSAIKVWEASTGTLKATFRGTSGHAFLNCDVQGMLVAGASTDKTCKIWSLKTQRMVHHLVGHAHKVTCVRLYNSEKNVITGSADRSMKIWDISSRTYRQTSTLRHSSTTNCLDVGLDSNYAVSGHMDGGLRFWDLRLGERSNDITGVHEGGITSVHFSPANSTHVLTRGTDSTLKIVDARTSETMITMWHNECHTSQSWSSARYSPDGKYVLAASSSNGKVFVWSALDGSLQTMLKGHDNGVAAVDWGHGGSSGQQVASLDRKGTLILWA